MSNRSVERFREYHDANPHVYAAFRRLTLRLIAHGRKHYSSDGILHVVRFETAVSGKHYDGLKINNNCSPFYARLFESEFPQYAGFFQRRRSAADEMEEVA